MLLVFDGTAVITTLVVVSSKYKYNLTEILYILLCCSTIFYIMTTQTLQHFFILPIKLLKIVKKNTCYNFPTDKKQQYHHTYGLCCHVSTDWATYFCLNLTWAWECGGWTRLKPNEHYSSYLNPTEPNSSLMQLRLGWAFLGCMTRTLRQTYG